MRANLDLTGGAIVSERLTVALAPALGKAAAKKLLTDGVGRGRATPAAPCERYSPPTRNCPPAFTPDQLSELLDPARYTGAADALIDRALHRNRSPDA